MTGRSDSQLGPYRLVRWLGDGGMGQVWEAVHCGRASAPVAIKVVRGTAGSHPMRAALREARIGLGLSHPNIAQTFDVGFVNGRAYVVLELLQGATIAELCPLAGEPLAPACAAGMALQALAGLHHAHTAVGDDGRPLRVVHHDVKPSNLFLTREGSVKLLDFGTASIAAAHRQDGTGCAGTLVYMAPERLAGGRGDNRSDLYALALVVAELLCGRSAFEALDEARARSVILRGEIALLRTLPAEVSPALRRWLEIALRPDPRERFESGAEMARALRACVADAWDPPALARWSAARLPIGQPDRADATRRLDRGDAEPAFVAAAPVTPWGVEAVRELPPVSSPVPPRTCSTPPRPVVVARAETPSARAPRATGPARRPTPPAATHGAPTAAAPSAARRSRWAAWAIAALALALPTMVGDVAAQPATRAPLVAPIVKAPRPRDASRQHGWITVRCRPGTRIRIGGKDLGEAAVQRYRLPAGRHVVEAIRADGTRLVRRVRVEPGRGEHLSFR
jgi:eukaryotic-like serine/threonine-protein kinase